MQQRHFSIRPSWTLSLYLISSVAIIILSAYYNGFVCGYPASGFCGVRVGNFDFGLFLSPIFVIILIPLAAGLVLLFLRLYRWRFSAFLVLRSVQGLTIISATAAGLITIGTFFAIANAQEYQDKQCYGNTPPSQYPPGQYQYCLEGKELSILARNLMPALMAVSFITLVLAIAYLYNF